MITRFFIISVITSFQFCFIFFKKIKRSTHLRLQPFARSKFHHKSFASLSSRLFQETTWKISILLSTTLPLLKIIVSLFFKNFHRNSTTPRKKKTHQIPSLNFGGFVLLTFRITNQPLERQTQHQTQTVSPLRRPNEHFPVFSFRFDVLLVFHFPL